MQCIVRIYPDKHELGNQQNDLSHPLRVSLMLELSLKDTILLSDYIEIVFKHG